VTPLLDVFTIILNEEELLQYCLDSYLHIVDLLGVVSLVDNGSTDATLDIIEAYKTKLPIVLQHHHENSHHGQLRTKALQPCRSPYIAYLDADETWTADIREWLLSGQYQSFGLIAFFKYTTIVDRFRYVTGGNGHTWRMFRNVPGANFPQSVHTEPASPQGWGSSTYLDPWNAPILFDHTSCKSREALWAKGARYQWAADIGVPSVGPIHEYIGRIDNTPPNTIAEFPENVKQRIFCGP